MALSPLHPEVTAAKAQIMEQGLVTEILRRQKKAGYWDNEEDFYVRAKYRGTTWQLIILAELGADGEDDRVRKACEFILDISQDRESGAFCYRGIAQNGGFHSGVLPCLTGNLVWSLIRFGYLDDPRVRMQEAAELVLEKQDDQGRWILENTFNGRFQVNIEQKGKPSKWVTLSALHALTSYFGR
jgi:hypothetical protein